MKTTILKFATATAICMALTVPASAGGIFGGGDKTYNTNSNKNYNSASARSSSSARQHQGQAQGQAQGQFQHNGNQSTVVNQDYEASAFAPGIGASDCSMSVSAGVIGGAAGLSIPSRKCNIREESKLIQAYGGNGAAHLCLINRVKRSQGAAFCGGGTSNRTYSAGTVATRSAQPVKALFSKCWRDAAGKLRIAMPKGSTSADTELAAQQCHDQLS